MMMTMMMTMAAVNFDLSPVSPGPHEEPHCVRQLPRR